MGTAVEATLVAAIPIVGYTIPIDSVNLFELCSLQLGSHPELLGKSNTKDNLKNNTPPLSDEGGFHGER